MVHISNQKIFLTPYNKNKQTNKKIILYFLHLKKWMKVLRLRQGTAYEYFTFPRFKEKGPIPERLFLLHKRFIKLPGIVTIGSTCWFVDLPGWFSFMLFLQVD